MLLSLILSVEVIVMADFIMVLKGIHFKLSLYGISMLLLVALFAFVVNASEGVMFAAIMTILAIPCLMYLLWLPFANSSRDFEDVDNGKAECYGNKKVLLIVPHQDDELNVLGGIFEEYLKYGSSIHIVYAIVSGAVYGIRYTEALNFCKRIGIPVSNVTFLGYGFVQWKPNANPPITTGTPDIPAYKEGQPCTRENMVNDLKEIISFLNPDVIYSSDFDHQAAHHLVTIAVDEALGRVLKERREYRPIVLKSYAYRTMWESYPDYYCCNIRSTRYMKAAVETYPWEERLRLPIAAHMLNRSLLHSEVFNQYRTFVSQGAVMRAINFNTDKVVWHRRSDSLLLNAKVEVSSGNGNRLNDFLLYDKEEKDMLMPDKLPTEGAWIPDAGDSEKEARFTLQHISDVKYLLIYQNPVADGVVDKVSISFNDEAPQEYCMRTDSLPTRIDVNKKKVHSFTLCIMGSKGSNAGLAEVEAFERSSERPFSLIKLMNESGDFVYDYWINKSGKDWFYLYVSGEAEALTGDNYSIHTDNPRCKAFVSNSQIMVYCPRNESTKMRIESKDTRYSDTVLISNPGRVKRFKYALGQKMEAMYYDIFIGDYHRKSTTLSMVSLIKQYTHAIRHKLR